MECIFCILFFKKSNPMLIEMFMQIMGWKGVWQRMYLCPNQIVILLRRLSLVTQNKSE